MEVGKEVFSQSSTGQFSEVLRIKRAFGPLEMERGGKNTVCLIIDNVIK